MVFVVFITIFVGMAASLPAKFGHFGNDTGTLGERIRLKLTTDTKIRLVEYRSSLVAANLPTAYLATHLLERRWRERGPQGMVRIIGLYQPIDKGFRLRFIWTRRRRHHRGVHTGCQRIGMVSRPTSGCRCLD